jgi:hypothetical protein
MTIPSPKTCRICSKPLSLHEQYSGQICSHWRCRWRHLEDQLRAHRQEAAQALGEAEADSFPITVVPRRTFRSVPLAPERRQEFAAFLADLVGEMADVGDPADAAPSVIAELEAATAPRDAAPVSALLAQVCAVCGGFCCYYGGTRHAFLDRETLQRVSGAAGDGRARHRGAIPGTAPADALRRVLRVPYGIRMRPAAQDARAHLQCLRVPRAEGRAAEFRHGEQRPGVRSGTA